MRRTLFALVFSFVMIYLPFLIEGANAYFRLAKISIDIPSRPDWNTEMPSKELLTLFSKPFYYLGKGAQAYVFESEDGSYVLKLFRGSCKIHPIRQCIRKYLHKKERKSVEEKIPPLFKACQIAYAKAPDLTALLYLHLNPTENLPLGSSLILRTKKKISVDLNQYRFVIQKKGKPLIDAFQKALKTNDRDKFMRLGQALVYLWKERTSRNIGNLDKTMWYNVGFIDETAIEWDFGRYYDHLNAAQKEEERIHFQQSLQKFFQSIAPQWPIELEEFFL